MKRTQIATNSILIFEATKKLPRKMLLTAKSAQNKIRRLNELLLLFDWCKHVILPSVRYTETDFKHIRMLKKMGNIIKICDSNN